MKTTQQILFACPASPRMSELAHALKQLDLGVTQAASFTAARRVARGMPGLALVVIDAAALSDSAEAEQLLCEIKDRDRRLPVLWIGAAISGKPLQPDLAVPSTLSASELCERAQLLLQDDLYPGSLVRALVSACNNALTVTLDCHVECAEPRLSRSALRPGNVSALMWVSDADTSAHFILSGHELALFGLAERIGFEASDGPRRLAVDLASELLNQIVGLVKANESTLSQLQLALPYVLTGEALCIYAPTPKPSLVVQLDVGDAPLTLDFWWKTRAAPDLEAERFMAELSAGDGLF